MQHKAKRRAAVGLFSKLPMSRTCLQYGNEFTISLVGQKMTWWFDPLLIETFFK